MNISSHSFLQISFIEIIRTAINRQILGLRAMRIFTSDRKKFVIKILMSEMSSKMGRQRKIF